MFFQLGLGGPTEAILGDEAAREALLDRLRALPPTQAAARVRELTADAG
jgi:hypothetical protein